MDTAAQPKIIVSTYTYNVESYILKALDSMIHQTYGNWEWYLIENASTDHTAQVIERFLSVHPDSRIHYSKRRYNSLLHPEAEELDEFTRVRPALYGNGYYFTTLDSDDYYAYDALETMAAPVIQENADYVITGRRGFWENSNQTTELRLPPRRSYSDPAELAQDWLKIYPCIRTAWSKLFRFDGFWSIYDHNVSGIMDMGNGNDTFVNLLYLEREATKVSCVDRVTVNFCVRRNSVFNSHVYPQRYRSYLKIYQQTITLFQKWKRPAAQNTYFARLVLKTSMLETTAAASRDIESSSNLQLFCNLLTDQALRQVLEPDGLYAEMVEDLFNLLLKNSVLRLPVREQQDAFSHFPFLLLQGLRLKKEAPYAGLCLLLAGVFRPDNPCGVGLQYLLQEWRTAECGRLSALSAIDTAELEAILREAPALFRALVTQDQDLGIRSYRAGDKSYFQVYYNIFEAIPPYHQVDQLEEEALNAIQANDLARLQRATARLQQLSPFGMTTLYATLYLLCQGNQLERALYICMAAPCLYPESALMVETAAAVFEELGYFQLAAEAYEGLLPSLEAPERALAQERAAELHRLQKSQQEANEGV